MFKLGDKVVYPVHGAGIIAGIENKFIEGEERLYYILNIYDNDSTMKLFIPKQKAENLGLRYISDEMMARRVYDILMEKSSAVDDKWSKRYRTYMNKIKSGNILELAELVRNLSAKNLELPLSTGEKKLLDQAMNILVSELAVIGEEKRDITQARIDNIFKK